MSHPRFHSYLRTVLAGEAGRKLQCCFFSGAGMSRFGVCWLIPGGLPPRWRTAGVDACPRLLQSSGSRSPPLPSWHRSPELPDSESSDAAGPLGGEGFSLAGDKENSEICFFQPKLKSPELQLDPALQCSSSQLSPLAGLVPRSGGRSSWMGRKLVPVLG